MNIELLTQLAENLDEAATTATPLEQLSLQHKLSLAEAYHIQLLSVAKRQARGEQLIGYKMGFTSREKMLQMGVDDLIWGRLTDAMVIADGGSIDLSRYVHPRAEPEIAFKMKSSLSGKVTVEEALAAVEAIAPAIEVIDSRYQNFKFSLSDVIADNCSSTGLVIGPWSSPEIDFGQLSMALRINNEEVASGTSAAILDHPINALVEAARCIAESGECIAAGQIILAGAATAAVALLPQQHIEIQVGTLGSCSFNTTRTEVSNEQ